MSTSYESDVVEWAREQAALIRAGRFDLLSADGVGSSRTSHPSGSRRFRPWLSPQKFIGSDRASNCWFQVCGSPCGPYPV